MIRLNTDAAVNVKTKKAGIGFIVVGPETYEQVAMPLSGKWDNHTAEWQALDLALEWLLEHNFTDEILFVYTDSKIVAESIIKDYAKNDKFQSYLKSISEKLDRFPLAEVKWIPEKQNKGADNLAKQGLAKAGS